MSAESTFEGKRVGERLREAREKQGINIAVAAERLHILPSYVNAMETGNYGILPGTVFLRGYVRSYARLLKLDEDTFVAQLDEELGQGSEIKRPLPLSPETLSKISTPNVSTGRKKWVMVLLLILMAALAWQYKDYLLQMVSDFQQKTISVEEKPALLQQERVAEKSLTSPESQPPKSAQSTTPSSEIVVQPTSTPKDPEKEVVVIDLALPPAPAPAALSDVQSEKPAVQSGEHTPEQEVNPAATIPPAEPVSESPVGQQPMLPADTSTSPPTAVPVDESLSEVTEGKARLFATFTGKCWFEIRDAKGKRQSALYRAGDHFEFVGTPPFKLVVGAADVAELQYNGVPVDFSQYKVWNNRVGLTLGQ